MALTILDDTITSDHTEHTARTVPGKERAWEVSWLPGRCLDRNSAITAMVLADVTGRGDMNHGHRLWIHVEGWEAELGLSALSVLSMTTQTARRNDSGKSAMPSDPDAAG